MAYIKKWERGEAITSLDELANEKMVYLPYGVRDCGWVQSMQFRFLKEMINQRRIYKAVKKEVTNG